MICSVHLSMWLYHVTHHSFWQVDQPDRPSEHISQSDSGQRSIQPDSWPGTAASQELPHTESRRNAGNMAGHDSLRMEKQFRNKMPKINELPSRSDHIFSHWQMFHSKWSVSSFNSMLNWGKPRAVCQGWSTWGVCFYKSMTGLNRTFTICSPEEDGRKSAFILSSPHHIPKRMEQINK